MEVVSLTPLPLYPHGKSARYPLERRLGGPQGRSGTRAAQPVAIPTELFEDNIKINIQETGGLSCGLYSCGQVEGSCNLAGEKRELL
jgi:hypothetical protein